MKFLSFIFLLSILVLTGCKSGGDSDLNSGFGIKNPDVTLPDNSGPIGEGSTSLLSIVSGNNQTVAVGGTAALPLVVLLIQAPGQPVANETVYFSVIGGSSNGTVSVASATTNASGYAEVYFSGGAIIGTANVLAIAPQGSATFTMNVTGATGYNLAPTPVTSGDAQTGYVNTTLLQPFRVLLTDADGDPVPGQTVRFAATGATVGNFSGALYIDTVTDASGLAQSTLLNLNTQAGVHTVNAFLIADSSVSTSFSATASVDPASVISPTFSTFTLSSGQVAADGSNTVDATIMIKDQYGNLIPNNTYVPSLVITPSPGLLGSSWLGSWSYDSTGTYKRTLLVGNTAGTVNFSSQINSVNLLSGDPTLILSANSTVINSNITLDATVSPLIADGISTTTIVLTLRDQFHNPINLAGQSVVIATSLGTLQGASMTYHAATGTYRQLLIAPTSTGGGSLTVSLQTINGVGVGGITKNIPLLSSVFSSANSFLSIPNSMYSGWGQSQTISVNLRDINNNPYVGPATVTISKILSQGASVGTFSNSGNMTYAGNGVYQINLTSSATICPAQPCTEDISAVATIGATTINLGPLRVHYRGANLVPVPGGSYVKMLNTTGKAGNGASVLVGTVYLRTGNPEQLQVGGMAHRITVIYAGCYPPQYSIKDNQNGTYTVTIPSPPAGCNGTAEFLLDGARMTATPGDHTVNPVAFTFFGNISLSNSIITVAPTTLSGPGSATVSLVAKDASGINVPNCSTFSVATIRFSENGHTDLNGPVTCSVIGGAATYQQIIERAAAPEVDFETVTLSAEFNDGASWNYFAGTVPFTITPVNLAGVTIDCNNNPYEDKPIYVNGGTLTINGWVNGAVPTTAFCSPGHPLRFKKLKIGSSGILTHSPATTANSYGIDIEVTESVVISPGGKIDTNERGYLRGDTVSGGPGYGPGNVANINGAATYGASISNTYMYCSLTQSPYGSSNDPNQPGSGGRTFLAPGSYWGGIGGGLIRIKAASFVNDGSITANSTPITSGCGGSGGGIKIDLETSPGTYGPLTGFGAITANGGDGMSTSEGGGGRIAILADMSGYAGAFPTAFTGLSQGTLVGGSIYISKSVPDIVLPHSMTFGTSQGSSLGPVSVTTHPNVTIPPLLSVYILAAVNWGNVSNSGTITFGPDSSMNLENLVVNSGANVTHDALSFANIAGGPKVKISAADTIEVKLGGAIQADGKGYPGSGLTNGLGSPNSCGVGFGFLCNSVTNRATKPFASNIMEGGSHYRAGGAFVGSFYGSIADANTYGGAGATWNAGNSWGSYGGGIVFLTADNIIVNGRISANGGGGLPGYIGGGAGGSVKIVTNTLDGATGVLASNGADASVGAVGYYTGGGAGGIVRVIRSSQTGSITTQVTPGKSYKDGVLDIDPTHQATAGDVLITTP